MSTSDLLRKIESLPTAQQQEVADFVDFLVTRQRERASRYRAARAKQPRFPAAEEHLHRRGDAIA